MLRHRVIPCLLMLNGGLVKTVKFKDPKYVGDPINAVRIFNDKEVDELAFLDIGATPSGSEPNFDLLADIASQAFMPFSYGGGITTVDQVKRLYALGIEKVILNTATATNPTLVEQAATVAGNSSVVVSIDVRRNWLGKYGVYVRGGRQDLKRDPVAHDYLPAAITVEVADDFESVTLSAVHAPARARLPPTTLYICALQVGQPTPRVPVARGVRYASPPPAELSVGHHGEARCHRIDRNGTTWFSSF